MPNESLKETILETMHSEHCSYKSTRKHLAGLHTRGEHVIQGPGENAGIVRLGGGLALALRIESHNHPSAIDPYNGAATGVGGIIRDIFTMGARPIALVDLLRFGTNTQVEHLLQGVVKGISDYGNCVGVPVVGGEVFFDRTYNGNPLVNVCCMGLVDEKKIIYGNALTPGNDLIYVGARTGRDGVGGASFSSQILEQDSPRNISAIQHGDPFLEKLLLEACVELAGTDWVEGMQDMGAAGLLCSTTEVAYRGQQKTGLSIGARVYLNRIPTKAENMTPRELLLSESQERMMIVGKRLYRDKIMEVFKKWDLEAVVVGEVTSDGNYTLVFSENGQEREEIMKLKEICGDIYQDWPLNKWVAQGSIYTKASQVITQRIWRQYDWRVGTRTVKGPNQPGSFAVLDLEEIGSELVVAWSSDEGRSDENPALGIKYAFEKTYSYIKDQKAKPLGLTNCLNFGYPEDSMGAFAQTTQELGRICKEYEVPVLSGNVSLYNGVSGHSIKPTPILVMVGLRGK